MNVKQLLNMLKTADQKATVMFEDVYGDDNLGPVNPTVITNVVWNTKVCTLTNEQ